MTIGIEELRKRVDELLKDYERWQDGDALVVDAKPPHSNNPGGTQNGISYTSPKVRAIRNLVAIADPKVQEEFYRVDWPSLRTRIDTIMVRLEIYPGALKRTSDNRGGHEAKDDHIAAGSISAETGSSFRHRWIVQGWRRTGYRPDPTVEVHRGKRWANRIGPILARVIPYFAMYHFNNRNPGTWHFSTWMGHSPHVIAMYEFSLGLRVPFWRKLWWCYSVWSTSRQKRGKDSKSHWRMVVDLVETGHDGSWICRKAEGIFRDRFEKQYPGGLGDMFQDQWGIHHPHSRWTMGQGLRWLKTVALWRKRR